MHAESSCTYFSELVSLSWINIYVYFEETPTKESDSLNTSLSEPMIAINDTAKVKRTQSRIQNGKIENAETGCKSVDLDTLKSVS